MNRRSLIARFMAPMRAIALVAAIQAGPGWPKSTVAASWDHRGYTDWSDGTRTFKLPLKLEVDVLFDQVLPISRYYGLPVRSVLDMPFQAFHRHLEAVPLEVLLS